MVSTALFLYLPRGVCGVCAWVWLDDWETRWETGPGDSWMVNARNARREKYRQSESKKKVYNNRLRQDELGPGTYVEGGEEEEHNITDTGRLFLSLKNSITDLSFFCHLVKIHIRSRIVTVEGPRGMQIQPPSSNTSLVERPSPVRSLTRSLSHLLGKLVKDLSHIAITFGRPEKNVISIQMHHGIRKGVATLRTVRTIINNLIIGVTKGFLYKMRYVYAHFPINVNVEKNAETGQHEVEIRYANTGLIGTGDKTA